ncbi:anti-sigma-I factor RsgI family protein [Enterocloster bolteae]|uniref:anti-sigma-I factor RsgI family protein n=1 Tax=Enterocloster bolteae TaxID=208479 RepID=UPI00321F66BA
MTYLVMECHPSYAIVLDNEGRMIKAANLGYQEGQVVGEIIARQTPKAPILFRLAPLAAAACLCLAVLGGGAYGAYGMPYGTVEVRINPDVKMSVSYMDRVVGLEGVNEDGKKLIDQVSYKGRNSEYMTGILVERAMEMGYLTEGGTIYVAASGGSERWKAKRADAIRTGLDTLLKDGMPVEVHVESIGKDSPPAASPHHKGEIPGGTGGDKPAFIGMPPGGTGEDADGNGEDDRDEDERGDDTENDDEENDADPDKYDEDDGDDREEDAGKDKAGDKDDGRDDDDKDDTDDRDDDIKKARDKSGRNNVVRQSSGADDDKDMDDSDERDNGKAGNGLNDNRDRDEDDGGEHSDQDDSDEGDSDEDDIDENDSQEEDNDGHEDGEDDKDEDEDDDD